jgi:hypothetical protein
VLQEICHYFFADVHVENAPRGASKNGRVLDGRHCRLVRSVNETIAATKGG